MSDYTKATDFAAKDALLTGNPSKIVKGTEIDAEFDAIQTAVATKADKASPALTGTPTAPTAANGTNTTQIATTAFVQTALTNAIANGGTATSDITMSGAMFKFAKGADVASATTLPLITDGNYFDVTGTTTITSFASVGVGTIIGLHFDGALTLTHNATDLILPGGANITTAAGDEAIFVEYASGDYRCLAYTPAALHPSAAGWTYTASQTATGSETSLDFTGIPAWVTEVEVMVNDLSTNGTSSIIIQLGDSGGIENGSYEGSSSSVTAGTGGNFTSGFAINSANSSGAFYKGKANISLLDSTNADYIFTSTMGRSDSGTTHSAGGFKSLTTVLTQVRITTEGGTNTFDSGSTVRVRYR